LSSEQVVSVLETAARIDTEGINPEQFFKAVENVYDEMMKK
jgi:hypothetical protein